MSYWRWAPYVPVAERKRKAEKKLKELTKKGQKITPIILVNKNISNTFWGKSWCKHLESFSDYDNRLPRGRTYVRNGSVLHLSIDPGCVTAMVQGSSLYNVKITFTAVAKNKWQEIIKNCSGQIASVIELLQGKFSNAVMETMTHPQKGLFPLPKEVTLHCSCPDSADMCKHLAAVLYGVGARLDQSPELLFVLRQVNHLDLLSSVTSPIHSSKQGKAKKLQNSDLANVFGIELESDPKSTPQPPKIRVKPVKKTPNKKNKVRAHYANR